ncbi:MAG: T9SS type A sorting domain-containing protein [Saprospiraceae bacterium]|jgi:hypothetical protein|nr:T9SS type A sorting domain-containing protein [Saprospiraceae bacterium]MCA0332686.1 T9SS type A sorting domain-containing protein [Bacteroidota bacterium]HQU96055.1 T9SS type A sorting domain-containing protein [Saprospiraceae bacterium]
MFKIIKLGLVAMLILTMLNLDAQCIQFSYDPAGNRIQRSYNPTCILSLSDGNSTSTAAQMNSLALTVSEENDLKGKTELFPNPAQSLITIRTNEFSKKAQIAMYNSTGAVVLTRGLTSDQIDISHLPPGLYVFLLTEQRGEQLISYKQKIIKQ